MKFYPYGLIIVACIGVCILFTFGGCVQAPPKAWYGSATQPDCAPWHHKDNMAPVHCTGGDGGGSQ